MAFTWTNSILNTIPADEHYEVGDFNYALFTVTDEGYNEPAK